MAAQVTERERPTPLTYHITLSEQGGWVKCARCGVDDGWSAEFYPDSEAIVRYVCLNCGTCHIEASLVIDRIVAHPADAEAWLALNGEYVRAAYAFWRVRLHAAGMDRDVAELDEWWGDSL